MRILVLLAVGFALALLASLPPPPIPAAPATVPTSTPTSTAPAVTPNLSGYLPVIVRAEPTPTLTPTHTPTPQATATSEATPTPTPTETRRPQADPNELIIGAWKTTVISDDGVPGNIYWEFTRNGRAILTIEVLGTAVSSVGEYWIIEDGPPVELWLDIPPLFPGDEPLYGYTLLSFPNANTMVWTHPNYPEEGDRGVYHRVSRVPSSKDVEGSARVQSANLLELYFARTDMP